MSIFRTTNQGMPAILYSLLFFYLVFAGAGRVESRRRALAKILTGCPSVLSVP